MSVIPVILSFLSFAVVAWGLLCMAVAINMLIDGLIQAFKG